MRLSRCWAIGARRQGDHRGVLDRQLSFMSAEPAVTGHPAMASSSFHQGP